jgi:hypothetical protein
MAGDFDNPARLLPQLYYASGALLPVETRKLLAACTVLFGGKCNPSGISGLEMVFALFDSEPQWLFASAFDNQVQRVYKGIAGLLDLPLI